MDPIVLVEDGFTMSYVTPNCLCRICKIPHLLEFPMLLDLLSDAYLMFHIKINNDSCDLLFHTHFISLDPKHDSRYNS